jgi:hypothetical protein
VFACLCFCIVITSFISIGRAFFMSVLAKSTLKFVMFSCLSSVFQVCQLCNIRVPWLSFRWLISCWEGHGWFQHKCQHRIYKPRWRICGISRLSPQKGIPPGLTRKYCGSHLWIAWGASMFFSCASLVDNQFHMTSISLLEATVSSN